MPLLSGSFLLYTVHIGFLKFFTNIQNMFIPQREPKKPKNWDYKYLFYYSLTVNNITYNIT